MYKNYFCLECEEVVPSTTIEDECPYCAGHNIVEDPTSPDDDWGDGHFEGDMPSRKHDNELE